MDQRFHPRYRLSRNVDVGIAYGPRAFIGKLVDFSQGGLQVTLSEQAPERLSCAPLEWNFNMEEVCGRGPGEAVRVQTLLSGNTRIGMAVPAAKITIEGKCFHDIVKVLSDDVCAGALRMSRSANAENKPVIEVIGKLHARLARDFTRLLADGCRVVDLTRCKDIDSGGIGLLAIAHDKGIFPIGAKGRVEALLNTVDRFQPRNALLSRPATMRFSNPTGRAFRH